MEIEDVRGQNDLGVTERVQPPEEIDLHGFELAGGLDDEVDHCQFLKPGTTSRLAMIPPAVSGGQLVARDQAIEDASDSGQRTHDRRFGDVVEQNPEAALSRHCAIPEPI